MSRASRPSGSRQAGFTLVEILVVVVIMAILISLAVLSINVTGRDAQLDEETRRLEGLIGLLHERALLEGRDFGLNIEPAAYEFLVYDTYHDRWQRLVADTEFRRRVLPKGLSFELQLDAQTVVLKAPERAFASGRALPDPQVAIAASGEGTPFRLTLLRQETNAHASVAGDAMGNLTHRNSDRPEKRT